MPCPTCGAVASRKDGRDRQDRQIDRGGACRRRSTARSRTPFSGYRFPPDVIALAVRWYLRYRLRYADVAELLAERGVRGDPSSVDAWVQECTPRDEAAARVFRRTVGERWSVDETYVKVAGACAYVYRALDDQGQVVDVYVSDRRASADAATCFRRAIEATGVAPAVVTTDRAPASPSALDAVLPTAMHEAGKQVQQRIARDHQHLKGRVRGMRSFKTLAGARVLCRAHGFLRNLRGGFYALGQPATAAQALSASALLPTWDALTTALSAR